MAAAKNSLRRLELPKRRWYNPRTWKRYLPLPPRKPLSSTWSYIRQTLQILRKGWKTIGSITLVYGLGMFVFVRSFSVGSADYTDVLQQLGPSFSGRIQGAVTQLSALLQDANASLSAASSVYQIIIATICCLALIYTFRQIMSHEATSAKQSFYYGMTPLVKYLLVLAMIGVHLIPVALGGYLYSLALSSGLLLGFENVIAFFIFSLFVVWSAYLISHSVFALFIVTLPNMTPLKSLRSAKKMVFRRRLLIWRKIVLALLCVVLLLVVCMLPCIIWLPVAAPWVFFVCTVLLLPLGQTYLYVIYREIL